MQVHNPSLNTLKCPTCRLTFDSQLIHKQHYKSDFHRYNIKRSMVSLPPATYEQFQTKKSQTRNQRQTNFQCNQCRKTFSSAQTLNQHAQTKKHDINKIIEERSKPIEIKRKIIPTKNDKLCLFCVHQSSTLQQNLTHMSLAHSFFISQQSYCINKTGLLHYLQQKIQVGMMCIFCDNKGAHDFISGDSVRKHMLSKNHTFMNTQKGFEEYQDYYDFSELFKQKLQEQKFFQAPAGINFEKVKVIINEDQIKAKQLKKEKINKQNEEKQEQDQQWEDQQSEQDDGEWQDDSDASQQQTDVIQQQDNEQQIKQKKKRQIKAYNIMVPTITNTDQLLLPNGKTLGHRKYRRFYKQSVKLTNWLENSNKLRMIGNSPAPEALILRESIMQQIKRQNMMKNIRNKQNKRALKVGMGNNNLQKFFRTSCSLG